MVVPLGAGPRRAMGGRWVQEAAAPAGRLLVGRDLACQVRVRWLDEIFLHRAPVLMAIELHSMAWMAGQRGPDRRGERWRAVSTHGPGLEPVIAAGGQGIARGVKLAHAARWAQGEAAATIARPARTLGLDVGHTQRARERVRQRQWQQAERQLDTARQADAKVQRDQRQRREPRGVSGVAGRAWRQAERRCAQAGHAPEAVQQLAAALSWFEATGRLYGRQTAQAHRDVASQQRHGAWWSKVKRLLSDERTLCHVDRWRAPLSAAVSAPGLREALTRLGYVNDQRRQAPGDDGMRVRQRVVIAQGLGARLCAPWQRASRRVADLLPHAVRASRAVACVNRVGRMPQGRHRHVRQGLLDLKRLYWNCRVFREGTRTGQSPDALLGLNLPTSNWWQRLQMAPEELEQKLLTQSVAA
jgi:hypothetical protein